MQEMLKNKIDVKSGRFSYGQRIAIGQLFEQHAENEETGQIAIFRGIFKILHDVDVPPGNVWIKKHIAYFNEINEGLIYWIEREKELTYEPTAEEKAAGIDQLLKEISPFGTIKALAQAYHSDPDKILEWDYAKVFNILRVDMKENMFRRKLEKVHQRKIKQKSGKSWNV